MARVEFDPDRYATDMGPACPKCGQPDGDTLWVYLCQYPYDLVVGQSSCCHEVVNFAIRDAFRTPNGTDIQTIKQEHRAWLDAKLTPEQFARKYGGK